MISDLIQAVILGLLQGFTEFLPVSSTAHLIILPKLMKWQDFGLGFDIIIHLGSLIAIIVYCAKNKAFKQEIMMLPLLRLCCFISVATVPVGISGLLLKNLIEKHARSITLIAVTTIIFGIFLGIAYWYNQRKYHQQPNKLLSFKSLSAKYALLIGIAQAVAVIPGVSRSGVTLTAGLLLGFNLLSASRFSFVLSIPVIILAGCKQTVDLINGHQAIIDMPIMLIGFCCSMCSSFIFIFLFFKYISKIKIWPFVIYRIFLGIYLTIF
jgi:undecaprenyl-diphosphatase